LHRAVPATYGEPMTADVRIEHSYPSALPFLREHDVEALAVLHDLLAHAERRGGELVVEASVREIAERVGFVSNDAVHRRLRQLISAGVVRRLPIRSGVAFARGAYVLDLDDTGITISATAKNQRD
jgi:SOS-response transcriptional repressor LexA